MELKSSVLFFQSFQQFKILFWRSIEFHFFQFFFREKPLRLTILFKAIALNIELLYLLSTTWLLLLSFCQTPRRGWCSCASRLPVLHWTSFVSCWASNPPFVI